MVFQCSEDMSTINPLVNVYRGDEWLAKKADYVALAEKQIPCIRRILEERPGPFFFGETPYYCDFAWYHIWSNLLLVAPELIEGIDSIAAHMAATEQLPAIKEYLSSRPECLGVGTKPMLSFSPNDAAKA